MSNDHTDAFEADLEQEGSAADRRAALEAELAELDNGGADIAVREATTPAADEAIDGDWQDQEPEHGEAFTADCKTLGMKVTLWRPTDVDVTLFQQDASSSVLSDSERLAATGDFVREHMPPMVFRQWQRAIKQAARRDPRRGGRVFYEAVAEMLDALVDNVDETDESEMDDALNRAQRRAALKAKKNRENSQKKG